MIYRKAGMIYRKTETDIRNICQLLFALLLPNTVYAQNGGTLQLNIQGIWWPGNL